MKMLIVDDEIHIVDSLADTIDWRPTGITAVYKAYNAQEALETLQMQKIDIVVTDIRMPGMNGLELIDRIRQHWNRMKIVLLTGYADFDYAKHALEQNVSAYLVKPVADDEILQVVEKLTAELEEEWKSVVSSERALFTLRESFPLIQHNLLNELLQGRSFTRDSLADRLTAYQIPFRHDNPFVILAIRLEEGFEQKEQMGKMLLEYAVCNIAEEILGEEFILWHSKDPYDLHVFLASMKESTTGASTPHQRLSELALRVQHGVEFYLQGTLSVIVGRTGLFPADVPLRYQEILTAVRRAVGGENNIIFSDDEETEREDIRTIRTLYEHPTIPYLLDTGNWNKMDQRISDIFEELEEKWSASPEHLIEVMGYLLNAFSYISHKNGKSLAQAAPSEFEKIYDGTLLQSTRTLKVWAVGILAQLRQETYRDVQDIRITLIQKVQKYIVEHLQKDVALQSIADHVHHHPVYLSRIFKSIVNENISDYIHRLRMEKATYLLKETDMKVYEITENVGYENPQYFSKVFRKHYGQTPIEYRQANSFSS
jgi:two-component system response regulator YesN